MLVLFALLIAGLQTVYPLVLLPLVIGAAATIAVLVIRRLRRSLPDVDELLLAIGQLAMVCGPAAVSTPVAFARNAGPKGQPAVSVPDAAPAAGRHRAGLAFCRPASSTAWSTSATRRRSSLPWELCSRCCCSP